MESTVETRDEWATPGAHEVAPRIFRMPIPMPSDGLKAVNVYAVIGEGRVVLIDAGWSLLEAEEQLARSLALVDVGLEHVTDCLVTHAHRDHYTLAVAVRRKYGTRIHIGAGERANMESLSARQPFEEPRQVEMLRMAGAKELADDLRTMDTPFDNSEWELPDAWVEGGSVQALPNGRRLRAIHTPGHTTGHLVFHDEEHGVLFGGDHVLPHITPSIGYEQVPHAAPLSNYLTSLALLREIPDALLLPGHGPASRSVHERVDELLTHHDERLTETLRRLEEGPLSAFEVAGGLRWTRRRRRLDELDVFNKAMATLETAAHLDLLVERHLVTRAEAQDSVIRYSL